MSSEEKDNQDDRTLENEKNNQILNKFYSLKNDYDNKFSDYKKSLLKNTTLNMKQKRTNQNTNKLDM